MGGWPKMSSFYIALGVSAVIALAVAGAFFAGMYFQEQWQALRDLEDYKEGTEDAQDATTDLPADDRSRIDWLRDYLGR